VKNFLLGINTLKLTQEIIILPQNCDFCINIYPRFSFERNAFIQNQTLMWNGFSYLENKSCVVLTRGKLQTDPLLCFNSSTFTLINCENTTKGVFE